MDQAKGSAMKGVVLCGGLGTRLRPLTNVINKHLLPVHNKPMCFYPLQTMADAGIKDVMVVVGGQSTEAIMKLLRDGKSFGFRRLYYAYQEGEGGIAAALALTEQFVDGDDVCVILGDNILENSIALALAKFMREGKSGCGLFTTVVKDPENYGCLLAVDGKLRIVEKPSKDQITVNGSETEIVTGVYLYDLSVFQKIRECQPSARGELEITDVNNKYLDEQLVTKYRINGYWGDAGSSIEGLIEVGRVVEAKYKDFMMGNKKEAAAG